MMDIDFLNHAYLGPFTGSLKFYYATSIDDRIEYEHLDALLRGRAFPRFDSWGKKKTQFEGSPVLVEVWGSMEATVGEMLSVSVSALDGEWVLVASMGTWYDLDSGNVSRICVEAQLVMHVDLPLYARYLGEGRISNPFSGEVPVNGWAFELSPWEEILAYRVYVLERMCEREVYQFEADVFWEMIVFGDNRVTVEERRSGFTDKFGRGIAEVRDNRRGALDEVMAPFDGAAELVASAIPDEELTYMRRLDDVRASLARCFSVSSTVTASSLQDTYPTPRNRCPCPILTSRGLKLDLRKICCAGRRFWVCRHSPCLLPCEDNCKDVQVV